MTVKTCLLVTDDPDDHQAFSEAVSEISPTAIVLIVLSSEKAMELLRSKKLYPDYIFLDISMYGVKINSFLKMIKNDEDFKHTPTMAYGDVTDFGKVEHSDELTFFNKEYQYSELQNFLKTFINETES